MSKKIYIIDTNVLLNDHNAIYNYNTSDIVIPFQVLEEVDKFKKRIDNVGYNARTFIKMLDDLRKRGSLLTGVRIHRGKGKLFIKDTDVKASSLADTPDNKIIAVASVEKFNNPDKKVIVITNDINMRLKCDSIGVASENYTNAKTVTKREQLYSGFISHLVDDQIIDRFYNGEDIYIDKEDLKLYPNQFIMLISNQNDKKSALARFYNYAMPIKKVQEYKKGIFGIVPKNKEQVFALNMLMDPSIQLLSLTGPAGTGKTLISLATSLQQVIGEKSQYQKLLVSKPMLAVGGKDIGFLPGSKEEKILPWMSSISDNLEFLLGNDKNMLEDYIDKGIIELECMSFIRGRSIANAIMIFDEAQNLTHHEIKTIVTRVGLGTKLILIGDVSQIDNAFINEFTNGLTHVTERFKNESVFGHVTLTKGERSQVATLGSKLL